MRKLALFVLAGWILSATNTQASDVYLAQSAAGAATGADCGNAVAMSFFNSSSNWGSGAGKIGAGTTVHLCGTFSMSAGSSGALAFQGSGLAGSPITLLFEAGANAQAPYWGSSGFISSGGHSYVVIDGGANGLIRATANGANLSNHAAGVGVSMDGSSNSEVKNLQIANIFVAVSGSSADAVDAYGIHWQYGSNNRIDYNTLHDCRWCIYYAYQGSATTSNVEIDHNTIYNMDHGIAFGDGNSNAVLTGTNSLHDNTIHDFVMWDAPGNTDHHDGIHVWAVHSGSVINNIQLYNNYEYGDMGTTATAYEFIDAESGGAIVADIFNELIVNTSSAHSPGDPYIFFCCTTGANGSSAVNNTVIGVTTAIGAGIGTESASVTIKNNIFSTLNLGIYNQSGSISSDYNLFYNVSSVARVWNVNDYKTLAAWKASSGSPDAHSNTNNPNLSSTFELLAGSGAIAAGVNLSSMSVSPLDSDKAGNQRPSGSTSWDIGAYQFGSSVQANRPNPPTGLVATVN